MASKKAPTYGEHFRTEKLKEWPEAESVAFMEALAREDIDEAVCAILFRENYIAKIMVPSFCDPLFRRQQEMDEEKRALFQYKTVRMNIFHVSVRHLYVRNKPHLIVDCLKAVLSHLQLWGLKPWTSSEKLTCSEKKHLPDKENKTTDPSQTAFERKFCSLKLSQENKRDEKNCVVSYRELTI
ncbi:protein FAM228A [Meles meles]|uniref:protein FAM228A n=1 Tax=Meles meles TaxID=9662 RepID=UPI001E69B0F6|nr:protein FAM228A [Meles meles]